MTYLAFVIFRNDPSVHFSLWRRVLNVPGGALTAVRGQLTGAAQGHQVPAPHCACAHQSNTSRILRREEVRMWGLALLRTSGGHDRVDSSLMKAPEAVNRPASEQTSHAYSTTVVSGPGRLGTLGRGGNFHQAAAPAGPPAVTYIQPPLSPGRLHSPRNIPPYIYTARSTLYFTT